MTRNDHDPRYAGEEQNIPAEDLAGEREEVLQDETGDAPDAEATIAALEEELQSLTHSLAVARADFHNYRKRVERDRERERRAAGEEKVLEFLPVLDNLDRALEVSPDSDARTVLDGVGIVRRQFHNVLERLGVERIPAIGVPFSPEVHEAMSAVPTEDPEQNGIIVDEVLAGYRTEERVLRPAKVRVACYSRN